MKLTLVSRPTPSGATIISRPDFVYIPAANTDVQATWLRFGWIPPSRAEQHAVALQLNAMRFLPEEGGATKS